MSLKPPFGANAILTPETAINVHAEFIAGDADDTLSITRAIAKVVQDGRGVIVFDPGRTFTFAPITETVDNLTVIAYGAYIKCTADKTTNVVAIDMHGNNLQVLGGVWDYTVALTVNGDAASRAGAAHYFRFGGPSVATAGFFTDLLVRDTVIQNSRNTPIIVYGYTRARILNNTLIGALGNGIFCGDCPDALDIIGNHIWDTGDDGIAVVSDADLTTLCRNVTVTHNHLYACDQGIDFTGVDGGLIDHNTVELTWANAIFVWEDSGDGLGTCRNVRIGDNNVIIDANQMYGSAAAQTGRGVTNPRDRSTWHPSINSSPAGVKLANGVDRIELGFPLCTNTNPAGPDITTALTGTGVIRRSNFRAQPFTASGYIGTPGCNVVSAALTNGRVTYCKLSVPRGASAAKNVAIRSTGTPGSAGSVVRLGIYLDDGFSKPSRLLIDLGTVDTTTAGNKVLSIASGAGISLWGADYWLAAVGQGAPATAPTVFVLTNQADGVPTGSDASQITNGYFGNSVTGALPSSATINGFAQDAIAVRLGF